MVSEKLTSDFCFEKKNVGNSGPCDARPWQVKVPWICDDLPTDRLLNMLKGNKDIILKNGALPLPKMLGLIIYPTAWSRPVSE